MLSIYKTEEDTLLTLERPEKGCWLNLCDPTEGEIEFVSSQLGFDLDCAPPWTKRKERV